MSEAKTLNFRKVEQAFLFTFLALRLLLLARYYGVFLGYDVRGHLVVVSAISWMHPFLSLRSSYYAIHPPLGFLLAHTLVLLGISPLFAAQILSFIASLIAFFFMRQTLKSLGLLHKFPAIIFLYLGASIPMQIYLSLMVSLDVFVLCCMSIALFFSVQLFWLKQNTLTSMFHAGMLLITLSLASLFKLSGFFLLPIPFFVFIFTLDQYTWRRFSMVGLTTFVPFCAGMLYLYYRCYVPEHTFLFTTSGTVVWIDLYKNSMAWRNAHLVRFFLSYVFPIDGGGARLAATWASFWYMYGYEPISLTGRILGVLYYSFAWIPCLLGGIAIVRRKNTDLWSRFGFVILTSSILHLLCLFYFIYSLPLPGYFVSKGIYISSVSYGIAYLLVSSIPLEVSQIAQRFKSTLTSRRVQDYAFFFVALFMIVNHLFPALSRPSSIY